MVGGSQETEPNKLYNPRTDHSETSSMPKAKQIGNRRLSSCAIAHIKAGANLALAIKLRDNQGENTELISKCAVELFKTGHAFGVDEGFEDSDITVVFDDATTDFGTK